jgi:hypothetical protein
MASIYQQSTLTIAATRACDGSGGLFYQKDRNELQDKTINVDFMETTLEVVVRETFDHLGATEQSKFPLLSRAWAYQERILSPRIVHFCENELIWECCELTSCECGAYTPSYKAEHWKALSPSTKFQDICTRWQTMVEEYTKLRLTYPSDLLPGLSGVAKQMESFRKGQYFAGLWEDSLIMDLLWCGEGRSRKAKPRRAPSWSWASVDSRIYYGSKLEYRPSCRIEKAQIDIATSDPTGRVLSGSLTIYGQLRPAKLKYDLLGLFPPRLLGFPDESSVHFMGDYDYSTEEHPIKGFVEGSVAFSAVHCLKIASSGPDFVSGADFFLVLKLLDGEEQLYERVGLGQKQYLGDAWMAIHSGDDRFGVFSGVKSQLVTII